MVAPDPKSVKQRAIDEIKRKGKQTTERTKTYVLDITEDFLRLLATTDMDLSAISEIVVEPEEDFLEVGAIQLPDIKKQLQQSWT